MSKRVLGLLLVVHISRLQCRSVCLLALFTLATITGPALALEQKTQVVAAQDRQQILETSTVPSKAPVVQSSLEPDETLEKQDVAPAWQPPVAVEITIPSPVDPEQAKKLAEQWGVKLISLNLTSAGFMMDFRFRVLDASKAMSLFDHRIKPYVVAEQSNIKLPVPMAAKVGAMRPTNRGKNIVADKNYYMIFANPDRHVKHGEKVTVIIGDFKVEHLTVNATPQLSSL